MNDKEVIKLSENRKKEYGFLKPDVITEIGQKIKDELGVCSLARIQDYCKRKGLINPATGLPPSRQGIYFCLHKTEGGRLLLSHASHLRFMNRPANGYFEERIALAKKRKELKVANA